MITIFCFSFLVQVFFWLLIFSKLAFYQNKRDSNIRKVKVSLILSVKNEYENLWKLIPVLFQQDYQDYEVLIANDHSEDESLTLLRSFQRKYKNLRVIDIQKTEEKFNSKKLALTQAIAKAKSKIILLTDADCLPASSEWIGQMVNKFDNNTDIVLGFSPYYEVENSCLNAFIRFETLYTGIQYLSFALVGLPYMGVGRNLAYRKEVFEKNEGFNINKSVKGGDDDLLIGQIATSRNTKVCIDKNTFTYSTPEKTWRAWWRQKVRHLSVGKHYNFKIKSILGLLHLSQGLFYLSFFTILFFGKVSLYLSTLFCLRLLIVCMFYISISRKLGIKLNYWQVLCFDFLYICYIFIVGIWANSTKKVTWK